MTNQTWSRDGEMFEYDSLGELCDNYSDDICIGDTVYVADKVAPDVRRFGDL